MLESLTLSFNLQPGVKRIENFQALFGAFMLNFTRAQFLIGFKTGLLLPQNLQALRVNFDSPHAISWAISPKVHPILTPVCNPIYFTHS